MSSFGGKNPNFRSKVYVVILQELSFTFSSSDKSELKGLKSSGVSLRVPKS